MNPDSSRLKTGVAFVIFAVVFSICCIPASGKAGRTCLWTVASPQNTVYLLGSIHLLSRLDYPLPDDFRSAYRDSRVIVFETDLDRLEKPKTQALMRQHSLLPQGRVIREALSVPTFRMLEQHLDARGLDMALFEGLQPWVCAMSLTMIELRKRGYLPVYGIDRYFYRNAKRERKTMIPLEPVEEQLSLFFDLGRSEQDAFLKRTLTDLGMVDTLFPEMLALWKTGDLRELDRIMQTSFAGHPALYEKFLVRRNLKWLPVIQGLIGRPDNALVIVGASHLGGPDGLIRLLEDRGFRVVQK